MVSTSHYAIVTAFAATSLVVAVSLVAIFDVVNDINTFKESIEDDLVSFKARYFSPKLNKELYRAWPTKHGIQWSAPTAASPTVPLTRSSVSNVTAAMPQRPSVVAVQASVTVAPPRVGALPVPLVLLERLERTESQELMASRDNLEMPALPTSQKTPNSA